MTGEMLKGDGHIRIAPSDGILPDRLIVLLHGVGASAGAMAPIARELAKSLPQAAFVAMNGYDAFDMGDHGRQWFSVKGVTENNRAERVAEALPRIEALLTQEEEGLGFTRDQTIVIGFSQGAIMGLHLAVSAPTPPKAVISLAGRIAPPLEVASGPRPPVLLSHGTADPIISVAEMDIAAEALRQAGCEVRTLKVPGLSHSVHPQQIETIDEFIQKDI